MRDHVLENPQVDSRAFEANLRVLEVRDLPLDPNALGHGCTLRQDMISNAFPLDSDDLEPNPDMPKEDLDALEPAPHVPLP